LRERKSLKPNLETKVEEVKAVESTNLSIENQELENVLLEEVREDSQIPSDSEKLLSNPSRNIDEPEVHRYSEKTSTNTSLEPEKIKESPGKQSCVENFSNVQNISPDSLPSLKAEMKEIDLVNTPQNEAGKVPKKVQSDTQNSNTETLRENERICSLSSQNFEEPLVPRNSSRGCFATSQKVPSSKRTSSRSTKFSGPAPPAKPKELNKKD
jgi:hypothetical protein